MCHWIWPVRSQLILTRNFNFECETKYVYVHSAHYTVGQMSRWQLAIRMHTDFICHTWTNWANGTIDSGQRVYLPQFILFVECAEEFLTTKKLFKLLCHEEKNALSSRSTCHTTYTAYTRPDKFRPIRIDVQQNTILHIHTHIECLSRLQMHTSTRWKSVVDAPGIGMLTCFFFLFCFSSMFRTRIWAIRTNFWLLGKLYSSVCFGFSLFLDWQRQTSTLTPPGRNWSRAKKSWPRTKIKTERNRLLIGDNVPVLRI